jgi:hypothetical protein
LRKAKLKRHIPGRKLLESVQLKITLMSIKQSPRSRLRKPTPGEKLSTKSEKNSQIRTEVREEENLIVKSLSYPYLSPPIIRIRKRLTCTNSIDILEASHHLMCGEITVIPNYKMRLS